MVTKTDSINESNGYNISSLQYAWSDYNSKICYTNADSLLNKRDELLALLTKYHFDIIVITEVLPKNRQSADWHCGIFCKWLWFSTDLGISNGRGIIICVKSDINAIALKLLEYHHIEAIGIKIKLRSNDWLFLVAVCRSPNCSDECIAELEHVLGYDKEGLTRAKKGKRKVQGVPQSQTAALPRH